MSGVPIPPAARTTSGADTLICRPSLLTRITLLPGYAFDFQLEGLAILTIKTDPLAASFIQELTRRPLRPIRTAHGAFIAIRAAEFLVDDLRQFLPRISKILRRWRVSVSQPDR